jgi:hypothetical protein
VAGEENGEPAKGNEKGSWGACQGMGCRSVLGLTGGRLLFRLPAQAIPSRPRLPFNHKPEWFGLCSTVPAFTPIKFLSA